MLRPLSAVLCLFALCFLALNLPALHYAVWGSARSPDASSPLSKLSPFVGKWRAGGEMKGTAYSEARLSVSENSCDWSANRGFLICDQIIQSPSGPSNDLSIYTYNEKDHAFAFFGLSRNNPEPRATKLTIEGDLWTYSDEENDNGKHIRFRTTNRFTSPSTMVWRSEFSEDGVRWILMGEGQDTRIKPQD